MATFDTPLNVIDLEVFSAWLTKIKSHDLENGDSAVKKIVSDFYNGESCSVVGKFSGSYNFCFQIRFEHARGDMLLRFPIHGAVMNPSKKVEDEAAVMRFISEKTSIPIPKYHTHGIAVDEFDGLGPYILMDFVHGERLDEMLCVGDEFKPTITNEQLKKVYEQIAAMYLQLWSLDFNQIGTLSWDQRLMEWYVRPDPLTIKKNELEVRRIGIADSETQTTSDASVHMTRLINQSVLRIWDKSYSIPDEKTCRKDYLSLTSLQAMTPDMVKAEFLHGPFKLYNPDIRLGNMIADANYEIKFIDWDFCYVAPAQFLYNPPLGLTPLDMLDCTDDELEAFKVEFSKFIIILREKDAVFSALMEDCMEDGTFWYNQAVQEPEFWPGMLSRLWMIKGTLDVQDPPDMAVFIQVKLDQYRKKWNL